MRNDSPGVEAGAEARPVDASERLALLDVLRGFALCGVFVSNVYVWFTGRVLMPREQVEALQAPWVEQVADQLFGFFVNGRFMPIFSFLFGLGFSIQMMRAERRGASVVPVYARRLGVLFAFGVTHLFALWYGDVLSLYALAGLVLLLFRTKEDKTLLGWAGVLMFGPTLVAAVLHKYGPQLTPAPEVLKEAKARAFELYATGSYLDVVRANALSYYRLMFKPLWAAHFATTVGRFLLGLVAGRSGLFHDVEKHRRLLRKLWGWGLGVGLVGSGLGVAVNLLTKQKVLDSQEVWMLPLSTVKEVGAIGMSMFYVTSLARLFQRETWKRVLGVLAPAGRMALTNYLSQSVLGILVYDGVGLGLIGKVGPVRCILLTLGLYGVQIAWSHWWLGRFRFGPAEWVWRSLTYGKAQPMRLSPTRAPHPSPSGRGTG